MSLSMLSNLTYNQRWGYSNVEKPEDFDECHAVALLIDEYVSRAKDSERRHKEDITVIGESLVKVAVNRQMCEEFETEMSKITARLFHRTLFAKVVDRCRDYVVTLEFNTHSLNRYNALDAVLSRITDPFNYNGGSDVPRLVNRSAVLVEGQTEINTDGMDEGDDDEDE